MKILTWNIRSGGGNRLPLIAQQLLKLMPDIFVATEFRTNRYTYAFTESISDMYPHHTKADSFDPNVNSVAIFSRHMFKTLPCHVGEKDRHRFIGIQVGNIKIIGTYFAQKLQKKSQFDYLIEDAMKHGTKNKIIIGDLNTGTLELDSQKSSFFCEDEFVTLTTSYYADTYRNKNGKKKEYSWHSNGGYGYRIDHCLCDPTLLVKLKKARYIKTGKEMSDHIPLLVEFDIGWN